MARVFTVGKVAAITTVSFLLFVLVVLGYWHALPNPLDLKQQYPVVDHESGNLQLLKQPPTYWVPLENVSDIVQAAVVISEDWAFFEHDGYDLREIWRAIKVDIKTRSFKRGASTITQQVARNLYLHKEKTLQRKLKELLIAIKIERRLSKKRILEIYLNIAEWGDGIHGIYRASHHYFDKLPSGLDVQEAAFLAMLLPSPIRYGESFRNQELTPYATKTMQSIIQKLKQARHLTEEEAEAAGDLGGFWYPDIVFEDEYGYPL